MNGRRGRGGRRKGRGREGGDEGAAGVSKFIDARARSDSRVPAVFDVS